MQWTLSGSDDDLRGRASRRGCRTLRRDFRRRLGGWCRSRRRAHPRQVRPKLQIVPYYRGRVRERLGRPSSLNPISRHADRRLDVILVRRDVLTRTLMKTDSAFMALFFLRDFPCHSTFSQSAVCSGRPARHRPLSRGVHDLAQKSLAECFALCRVDNDKCARRPRTFRDTSSLSRLTEGEFTSLSRPQVGCVRLHKNSGAER